MLWAAIKTSENHYTVDHVQPVEQKVPEGPGEFLQQLQRQYYDYVDYGAATYTSLKPNPDDPPVVQNLVEEDDNCSQTTSLRDSNSSHQYAVPHIDTSQDISNNTSFENTGFVDTDDLNRNGPLAKDSKGQLARLEIIRKLSKSQADTFRLRSGKGCETGPISCSLPRPRKDHVPFHMRYGTPQHDPNIYAQPFENEPFYSELDGFAAPRHFRQYSTPPSVKSNYYHVLAPNNRGTLGSLRSSPMV